MHKREDFTYICDCSFKISQPFKYVDIVIASKCFLEKTD